MIFDAKHLRKKLCLQMVKPNRYQISFALMICLQLLILPPLQGFAQPQKSGYQASQHFIDQAPPSVLFLGNLNLAQPQPLTNTLLKSCTICSTSGVTDIVSGATRIDKPSIDFKAGVRFIVMSPWVNPQGQVIIVRFSDLKQLDQLSKGTDSSTIPLHSDYVAGQRFGSWLALTLSPDALTKNTALIQKIIDTQPRTGHHVTINTWDPIQNFKPMLKMTLNMVASEFLAITQYGQSPNTATTINKLIDQMISQLEKVHLISAHLEENADHVHFATNLSIPSYEPSEHSGARERFKQIAKGSPKSTYSAVFIDGSAKHYIWIYALLSPHLPKVKKIMDSKEFAKIKSSTTPYPTGLFYDDLFNYAYTLNKDRMYWNQLAALWAEDLSTFIPMKILTTPLENVGKKHLSGFELNMTETKLTALGKEHAANQHVNDTMSLGAYKESISISITALDNDFNLSSVLDTLDMYVRDIQSKERKISPVAEQVLKTIPSSVVLAGGTSIMNLVLKTEQFVTGNGKDKSKFFSTLRSVLSKRGPIADLIFWSHQHNGGLGLKMKVSKESVHTVLNAFKASQ